MAEKDPQRPLRAAALRYDQGTTPRVVAVGKGEVARRIIEEARAAGVPIRDDAPLAEALATLELDADVPEELWAAVAEALVWAYRMDLGALREARRA